MLTVVRHAVRDMLTTLLPRALRRSGLDQYAVHAEQTFSAIDFDTIDTAKAIAEATCELGDAVSKSLGTTPNIDSGDLLVTHVIYTAAAEMSLAYGQLCGQIYNVQAKPTEVLKRTIINMYRLASALPALYDNVQSHERDAEYHATITNVPADVTGSSQEPRDDQRFSRLEVDD